VTEGENNTIRSYQRIFTPDRRLYSIEGHPVPVPGGVPLRWLGYASGSLIAVLLLASGSPLIALLAGGAAAIVGLGVGGRVGAVTAGVAGVAAVLVGGLVIGALDWPVRLIVIPAAVATLATQATPDGRRAHRFAASWLALRLAPPRQSNGRALPGDPAAGGRHGWALWVATDSRTVELPRGTFKGPAQLVFANPVEARRQGRRWRIRPLGAQARRGSVVRGLTIEPGERVEVRP
jgi:hypothetical protein